MTASWSLERWRAELRRTKRVGDCDEWQGTYFSSTPIVYCPRDYLWPGSAAQGWSVRVVLWTLTHGQRGPADQVIRPSCRNPRCVAPAHWLVIDRRRQAQEQSARGELQTAKRGAANKRKARRHAKLDPGKVLAIIASGEPSRIEAARHGVSRSTITAVRRRQLWALDEAPACRAAVDPRRVDLHTFGGGEFSRLGVGRYLEVPT